MREVASFDDERMARRFADVLCARDIETEVSESRAGQYSVWVLREADVETSRAAWASFDSNPDAPEHRATEGCVDSKQRKEEAQVRRSRHEVIDMRRRLATPASGPVPVTLGIVVASAAISLVTRFGQGSAVLGALLIGAPDEPLFALVLSGQVWRLVTPIFVHFGFLHIFFNGWWFLDIGAAIERRIGSISLLFLVLVTAVFSNALQYVVEGSPMFGGLSGVLYALLGFAWVRGRRDLSFGFVLSQQTIVILLVWLGLGFVGVLGHVANYAHLGGLISGAALGALPSRAPHR